MKPVPLWYKNATAKLDKKVEAGDISLEEWEKEIEELNHELYAWFDDFKRGCG